MVCVTQPVNSFFSSVNYLLLKVSFVYVIRLKGGSFRSHCIPFHAGCAAVLKLWLHRSDYIKSYKQKHDLCSPR